MEFDDVATLPLAALTARGINDVVAKKYGVRVEYDTGTREEICYYFPIYLNDELIAYQAKKARSPGERQKGDVHNLTVTKGAAKEHDPFGSKVAGSSGKFIVVTEGAEDCLAAVQMLNQLNKGYRVVATLGTDRWRSQLEYFRQFEKVVIAFDPDDAGKKAASDFADALGKKAWIASLPSDPNQMLIDGSAKGFVDAVFAAKEYAPVGFIYGEAVWNIMKNYTKPVTLPYPEEWEILSRKMERIREAEISLWTAGTSTGKTSFVRRLKQHYLQTQPQYKIAEIELEEAPAKTFRGLMQFYAGKPWSEMNPDERRYAYEQTYGTNRIITLDHRSYAKDSGSILNKMYYAHYTLGCKIIFLDHITLAVTEFEEGEATNAAQDKMMSEFLTFVEKTKSHLCIISHLRKTGQGSKDYEVGAVPSKADLKGSGSLSQISFDIIGVSRNQMAPDEYERNVSQLHVLKCRETGDTGAADRLYWDKDIMSLVPSQSAITEDF